MKKLSEEAWERSKSEEIRTDGVRFAPSPIRPSEGGRLVYQTKGGSTTGARVTCVSRGAFQFAEGVRQPTTFERRSLTFGFEALYPHVLSWENVGRNQQS